MARLQEEYLKNIKPNLMKELGLKNIFSVPELKKVVIMPIHKTISRIQRTAKLKVIGIRRIT